MTPLALRSIMASKRQREIEARRAADPLAQALGRSDIDYSSDDLPTAPRTVRFRPDAICPQCQLVIGAGDGQCTGWHPGFKCECGFEAGAHGTEYKFCPACGKPRLIEIFNDGIIQGRI